MAALCPEGGVTPEGGRPRRGAPACPPAPGARRARRAPGAGDLNLVGRARREPLRGRAVHDSAPSLPSLRPGESGTRAPRRARLRAPRGPSGTRRARRRRAPRPPPSGPRGHPRAARAGDVEPAASALHGAGPHARRSRRAHGPEGGVVGACGRPCGRRASWRYAWHEVPINGRVINGPSAADQSTRFSIMGCYNWLFRGSCGLTPRPRCQPGSGAARSEPVFPTKREGPARRRRRHAMAAEALVPPGATRVAIRIATRVATVYTNAPKRRGEARSSHLCTLLRSQGHPQPKPTAQQCTQTPQNGAERPFLPICVHSCVRRPGGEAHVASAVTPTSPGR